MLALALRACGSVTSPSRDGVGDARPQGRQVCASAWNDEHAIEIVHAGELLREP